MMDRQNDATIAWIVAGVLGVLLIITVFFWISARNDLSVVLKGGTDQITLERNKIAQDCGTAGSKAACNQDLANLAAILKDFGTNIEAASSTAPVNQ